MIKNIPISLAATFEPQKISIPALPEGEGQLPVDVLEREDAILIITPIAGVDLEHTEIVIANDVLTIRGRRESRAEEFGFKKSAMHTGECFWGGFSRAVILPPDADADGIEATQKDHVLYVRIPRRRQVKMRIVKIKP